MKLIEKDAVGSFGFGCGRMRAWVAEESRSLHFPLQRASALIGARLRSDDIRGSRARSGVRHFAPMSMRHTGFLRFARDDTFRGGESGTAGWGGWLDGGPLRYSGSPCQGWM